MNEKKPILDADIASAELCKRKLSRFVKEFWEVVIAEELVWEPHMDVLCDELQIVYERVFLQPDPGNPGKKCRLPKIHDLVINIPPGTSKSTIVTIMAPAWAWTKDASIRNITGSYSDSLATEHSVKSRDIIQCDKYRLYFPDVQIKDHKGLKTNYETTSNGQRYTTSVGGTVTGVHAHVITVDDPLNPKQAASQVECKSANDWMDKTLSMRKVDKRVTVTILIMQRLATNDPTGHLLAKKKLNVKHINLPAELSDAVSPAKYKEIYQNGLLSPKRLDKESLKEAKIDLGSDGYSAQMALTPVQEGGLIWQKWFISLDDALFPPLKDMIQVGTDWDPAYTKNDKNSASAYIRSGKIGNKMFIDDLGAVYLEFPELIKFMKKCKAPHYVEAKASGKSAKQTLVKLGIPSIEVKVEGGDKIARAKMSSPYAESGMCYIRKSLIDFLYNDDKQGILNFPKGSHTDLADVLAQAIQRVFKGRVVVGSPGGATGKKSLLDSLD